MQTREHDVDFCVVGGGLSGLCAALAAARRGARVVLLQDRPVLGGNSSSEIRMWIGGARDCRETGILEGLLLENMRRNHEGNWRYWDLVLWEAAHLQENLTVLLNCTVNELGMVEGAPATGTAPEGSRIEWVRGWQLTTETFHVVRASLFADCTGDGILAPLSGAEFRRGRESCNEFGEDILPEEADCKTMGLSLLAQPREMPRPIEFTPPAWANVYEEKDLPHRGHDIRKQNFWWIELGGDRDAIHDAETLRDELLACVMGVWDHVKNRGDHDAANWALDWFGMLPGKRESRRYVGDHILTQNDVRDGGRFPDVVAFGGWSMDDHHPAGLNYPGEPTIFHPAPSPYGIPYRCLYSRNVENLFAGGRAISVTHAALSSTRVMATCSVIGQAIGTAAAVAVAEGLPPRGVHERELATLQQALMEDDCYLPGFSRQVHPLTAEAVFLASEGDPEPLRNGVDRPVGEEANAWDCQPGGWVEMSFADPRTISGLRIVFDSNCLRGDTRSNMPACYPLEGFHLVPPPQLVRSYRVDVADNAAPDGWRTIHSEADNHQRFRRVSVTATGQRFRLVVDRTWGDERCRVFAWDLL